MVHNGHVAKGTYQVLDRMLKEKMLINFVDCLAYSWCKQDFYRWGNEKNYKIAMMEHLYWSRMSGPHRNYIDIPIVNIRGPSLPSIIMSFLWFLK